VGGFPAARLTDPTVHGGVIVVGCPTVLINNLPASRIGDTHVCPMVTVLVPHVGGPLILGSLTVIVGGVPQSRVTDMLICIGPPDAVVNGSPNVMVGMAGAAGGLGAVLGAALAGLKNFLGGYPKAVLQPDGTIATQYSPNITVEGTPDFQAKAIRDLNLIAGTPSGKKLLASLNSSGKHLRIHIDTAGGNGPGNWAWTDPPPKGKHAPGYLRKDGKPGDPADTQVGYDPDRTSLSGPPGSPYNSAKWAQPPNRPADVGLFHEMTHADDMEHGKLDNSDGTNTGPMAGTPISNSELRAAGITPYDKEDYSENTYRSDRGVAQRDFY
jgi:uncharacterized Zn-binding protein involved in type VI secretion